MRTVIHDLQYAIRVLRKSPGFAVVAILTLALGVGANVAIFSVVNAVLLQPLPFHDPDRLVRVFDDLNGGKDVGMAVPEFLDLQGQPGSSVFDEVSALVPASAALTGGDHAERIELLGTSPSYFHLLGAAAAIGHVYQPADAVPGFCDCAVISDGLWQRQFGGDPHVIGRRIRVDEDAYTIIGVMPPGFRHPGQTLNGDVELWLAAGFIANPFPNPPVRAVRLLPGAMGRLKAGLTLHQAQAQLDSLVAQLEQTYPADYPRGSRWSLRLEPVQENLTGNVRPTLLVLFAAVGLLLLTVCVNLASLTMAGSSGRRHELAVRQALGASRGRIVRQLLTESILIATLGGLSAILVLRAAQGSLLRYMPTALPRLSEVHLDARVLGMALLLSVVTGILFGLTPAWQASGMDPNGDLKEGGRSGSAGARQHRFRSAMVLAEVALSVVLLIGAGLLVRSFAHALALNPGLDPNGVTVSQVWIPVPNNPQANRYLTVPQRSALVRDILCQLAEIPGMRQVAVGTGSSVPFLGNVRNPVGFSWADDAPAASGSRSAEFAAVSPDYFQVLRTPLQRGRFFTEDDTDKTSPVVLVNESFVKNYSYHRDPIGRQFRAGRGAPWTIVGIVGDVRDDGLDVPVSPHVYFSIYQRSGAELAMFLRSSMQGAALRETVAGTIRRIDPELPVYGTRSMQELMAASMASRKFSLFLMGVFAGVAVLVAAIGVYGVMAFAMAQRSREYSIRMALGAQRGDILRIALRPALALTLAGTVAGLLLAMAAGRLMSSLLFRVSPADPLTFAVVAAILVAVALVACWVPAQRAARTSTALALKS